MSEVPDKREIVPHNLPDDNVCFHNIKNRILGVMGSMDLIGIIDGNDKLNIMRDSINGVEIKYCSDDRGKILPQTMILQYYEILEKLNPSEYEKCKKEAEDFKKIVTEIDETIQAFKACSFTSVEDAQKWSQKIQDIYAREDVRDDYIYVNFEKLGDLLMNKCQKL